MTNTDRAARLARLVEHLPATDNRQIAELAARVLPYLDAAAERFGSFDAAVDAIVALLAADAISAEQRVNKYGENIMRDTVAACIARGRETNSVADAYFAAKAAR